MNVVVDDLLVAYTKSGGGKPVLMLPGWGDTMRTYHDLIRTLQSKYLCIALDLPGFGQSQPPPTAWDLDDYVKFIKLFLQKIEQPQLYAVIGHSNGAAVAIRALGTHKVLAERAVLLGASGVRNKQSKRKLAIKAVAKTGKFLAKPLPYGVQQKLRKKLYGAVGSDMLVIPHMQETYQRVVGQDVQKDAALLKQKVLFIYGSMDQDTPVTDGRRLHKLVRGSHLEVIEGAGHFVHHNKPAEVNKLIREFLA